MLIPLYFMMLVIGVADEVIMYLRDRKENRDDK